VRWSARVFPWCCNACKLGCARSLRAQSAVHMFTCCTECATEAGGRGLPWRRGCRSAHVNCVALTEHQVAEHHFAKSAPLTPAGASGRAGAVPGRQGDRVQEAAAEELAPQDGPPAGARSSLPEHSCVACCRPGVPGRHACGAGRGYLECSRCGCADGGASIPGSRAPGSAAGLRSAPLAEAAAASRTGRGVCAGRVRPS